MRKSGLKAGRMTVVCGFFLLQIACSSAFAQGSVTPAPAVDAIKDDARDSGPFGGCEPIGMTASGELVFPLECKHKIQLQPAPVASEEKPPIVGDKPVATAEASPAVVDVPEKAAGDRPAVDAKAATADDKPVAPTQATTEVKPAASETLAATDKAPAPTAQKPAEAMPSQQGAEKVATETPETSKAEKPKADRERPLKKISRRAANRQIAAKVLAGRQLFAMAKPAAPPAHIEEKAAATQTAGLLPCAHYRSSNPAAKSYRGFDGRMYACR